MGMFVGVSAHWHWEFDEDGRVSLASESGCQIETRVLAAGLEGGRFASVSHRSAALLLEVHGRFLEKGADARLALQDAVSITAACLFDPPGQIPEGAVPSRVHVLRPCSGLGFAMAELRVGAVPVFCSGEVKGSFAHVVSLGRFPAWFEDGTRAYVQPHQALMLPSRALRAHDSLAVI